MSRKIVHVVGTGTIGEPLIGLLCDYKEQLGIDQITFHKNSPLKDDRSKVISLLKRGARIAVNEDKIQGFKDLDIGFLTGTLDVPGVLAPPILLVLSLGLDVPTPNSGFGAFGCAGGSAVATALGLDCPLIFC